MLFSFTFIHQESFNLGQGHDGSGAYPGNSGGEAGTHPECDTFSLHGTTHSLTSRGILQEPIHLLDVFGRWTWEETREHGQPEGN